LCQPSASRREGFIAGKNFSAGRKAGGGSGRCRGFELEPFEILLRTRRPPVIDAQAVSSLPQPLKYQSWLAAKTSGDSISADKFGTSEEPR